MRRSDQGPEFPQPPHHSVATLRATGVTMLLGTGGFVPHAPKQGDPDAHRTRGAALDALPA
ncbi:hypothetical protein [Streptomyces sp. GS7]|uniref:hypothetical protein n=1 Tax=Streptomyces sp. GS7 TaxID=2692234 RepID=UPI001318A268|nr:hypothetical protein [Streptomyces sp. GS7]QHC23116.1 hypothetical protein GR130_18570 [Streptomyces sp. GS7]